MAQLPSTKIVEPFGEVNVWPQPDGTTRVKATILMTPQVEGAQTGLAIDGSLSMKAMFGGSAAVSALFSQGNPNVVEMVARPLASYLANFDTDGLTTVIYWACGPGGTEVEEIGDIAGEAAKTKAFPPPKKFGTGTRLLPAMKYFTETKFPDAPWSIFVFITDGLIEDLEEVKQHSLVIGRELHDGKRSFVKLVLIGVGNEVDEGQMVELDDLDYGGLDVDLWDHKLAGEMQKIEEIFAEIVSADTILAPTAEVVDGQGNPVTPIGRSSYGDGLPALLEFIVPAGSEEFGLILPGLAKITQTIKL